MTMTRKLLIRRKSRDQLQEEQLRRFVRKILSEEIVSIIRSDGTEEIWDVNLLSGQISNAKKITNDKGKINYEGLGLNSEDEERIDTAFEMGQKYSTVSKGQIAKTLLDVQEDPGSGGVRQSWPGVEKALEIIKKYWIHATLWRPASRKGRGEAAMHMAFESVLQNEEPDFNASADERYSIKYFSNPRSSTAKNAGSPSAETMKSLVDFAKAIHVNDWLNKSIDSSNVFGLLRDISKEFSGTNNLKPDGLREYLRTTEGIDELKKSWAGDAKQALDDLKTSILTEHKASGMIVITPRNKKAEFVSSDETNKLKIRYIRDESRVEFGLKELSDSFEAVIDELKSGNFDSSEEETS